jgi:hypothetical protein
MTEGAAFYCSNGLASESMCISDDLYRTLPPQRYSGRQGKPSIELCGTLSGLPRKGTTVLDYIVQYEHGLVQLLSYYIGRELSFESDTLNAFSGIINEQSRSLGQSRFGLPLRLFARALFLSISAEAGPLSRRPEFPSWSWLGSKVEISAPKVDLEDGSFQHWDGKRRVYWTLVHMYLHTGIGTPSLLLGPLNDDNGVEGYCTRSIELYNRLTPARALPIEPYIGAAPSTLRASPTLPALIFWTHITRLNLLSPLEEPVALEVYIHCPKARARMQSEAAPEFEVALVAITKDFPNEYHRYQNQEWHTVKQSWDRQDGEHELSGIIIERWQGLTRRVGVVHRIGIQQWISAGPQSELLLLV